MARPIGGEDKPVHDWPPGELLMEALKDMGIPHRVIGGSIPERIERIVDEFDMPVVVPIEEARRRARADIEDLKADARFHEAQRQKSLLRRLPYAVRY